MNNTMLHIVSVDPLCIRRATWCANMYVHVHVHEHVGEKAI